MAVSVTSSGIVFPASQSASGDANTLDDYEEGDWTCEVHPGSGSWGANTGTMTYVKVGAKVTLGGLVTCSSENSASGHMTWSGLPFTSRSGEKQKVPVAYWFNGLTSGDVTQFCPELTPNQSGINVYRQNGTGGITSDTGDYGDNSFDFRLTAVYMTA